MEYLTARGEKVGVLKVQAVPAVLDRSVSCTRCLDRPAPSPCSTAPRNRAPSASRSIWMWSAALAERPALHAPRVVGGRYGLSSKEFTPAMVKAVFDELAQGRIRRNHFTVGIVDDVTHTSLACDAGVRHGSRRRGQLAVLRSRGRRHGRAPTRTPSRSSAEETDRYVQGYFVYDSKKSGAIDGLAPAGEPPSDPLGSYLISNARFVACHQFEFLEKVDVLEHAAPGAVFLLNVAGDSDASGSGCRARCRSR